MNKEDLSIATITWARDEEEETLLRQALQELSKLKIPVFITDGGSNKSFLTFIESFQHFTLINATIKGVFAQAKSSLMEAYKTGAKYILYTEPDKHGFFKSGLPIMLDHANFDEQSGVLLASRSVNSFATFPAFQQMTETTINNCCEEIISKHSDYTYGPFIMNRQLVPYLNLVKENLGWGWRPYTFIMAKRLGLTVDMFTDEFSCPVTQQEDNAKERIYRMRQLCENIQGIVVSTKIELNEITTLEGV